MKRRDEYREQFSGFQFGESSRRFPRTSTFETAFEKSRNFRAANRHAIN